MVNFHRIQEKIVGNGLRFGLIVGGYYYTSRDTNLYYKFIAICYEIANKLLTQTDRKL